MKQHPDRQPRRAEAVQSSDDDDRRTDQNFKSSWIDGEMLLKSNLQGEFSLGIVRLSV
jgi:hypothetical protein